LGVGVKDTITYRLHLEREFVSRPEGEGFDIDPGFPLRKKRLRQMAD